jgi:predicted PurR-regulated permease PerM
VGGRGPRGARAAGRRQRTGLAGPFSLQPRQVDEVREQIITAAQRVAPSGVAAASTVLSVLSGVAIALFVLFFLLNDGARLWAGLVATTPPRLRERAAHAGEQAWDTLARYVLASSSSRWPTPC